MAIEGLTPDPARHAVSALAGYSYQIWRSVLVWLVLADDEALDLEGNEDLDRLGPNAEASTTQIKDTAGSGALTLRSPDIVEAINNFWLAKHRNPKVRLRYRFLSTAGITIERGGGLSGEAGLRVWQMARRQGNKAEDRSRAARIRRFLLEIDVNSSLKTWLATATDTEVLVDLIVPIEWDLDAEGTNDVQSLIDSRLVLLGEKFGVLPSDSIRMRSKLFEVALATATSKTERRLLRVDLLKLFEAGTTRAVPASAALAIASQSDALAASPRALRLSGDSARLSAAVRETMPEPYGIYVARHQIVASLIGGASRSGFMYVCGSTGVGKSTLVQLATMYMAPPPLWIDLRDLRDLAATVVRVATRNLLDANAPRSLVLDDLVFEGDTRALQDAVAEAVSAVVATGGVIYASGSNRLPSTVRTRLQLSDDSCFEVPPLSEDEIEELLALHGCPPGELRTGWCKAVTVHARGHPQLVVARIRTLKSRGFPPVSVQEFLTVPADVGEVRAEARSLIQELPTSDRELLYRLSLTTARFRRHVALRIASAEPAILQPGDAFDRLIGPWVEQVEANSFRVSPLTNNAGVEACGEEWANQMHAALADAIFDQSLNIQEVSNILFHAVMGRNARTLIRMCLVLLTRRRDLAPVAEWIQWLVNIDADDSDRPPIATSFEDRFILRMTQFNVAVYGSSDRAMTAGIALDRHTQITGPSDVAKVFRVLALASMLIKVEVPFPSRTVVRHLVEFVQLLDQLPTIKEIATRLPPELIEVGGKLDVGWLTAVSMHGRVDTAQRLAELFGELDSVPSHLRARLIFRLANSTPVAQHLVNQVWLAEFKRPPGDWEALLLVLRDSFAKAKSWGAAGMSIAIATGIVLTLNENLERHEEARSFGEEALGELGGDPRLLDALADVYDSLDNPVAAFHLRKRAVSVWKPSEDDRLGPVIGHRKAAISANKIGDRVLAKELFVQASDLCGEVKPSLNAGLLADAGHAAISAGERIVGIRLIHRALDCLRSVPNTNEHPIEFRTHKVVGQLTNWLASQADGKPSDANWEPPIGSCSSFEVVDSILALPQTPVEYSLINLGRYACDLLGKLPELRQGLRELRGSPFSMLRFIERRIEADVAILNSEFDTLPEVVTALTSEYFSLRSFNSSGNLSPFHTSLDFHALGFA